MFFLQQSLPNNMQLELNPKAIFRFLGRELVFFKEMDNLMDAMMNPKNFYSGKTFMQFMQAQAKLFQHFFELALFFAPKDER